VVIVIDGVVGAGKTTISNLVAQKTDLHLYDRQRKHRSL